MKQQSFIAISRRAADRIRDGHVWVYSSDVQSLPEGIVPGAVVPVADNRGIPLGSAIYSAASQIALRMVSTDPALDRAGYLTLVRERVHTSVSRRENQAACRLIFSEADELPGIVLDRYNDLAVLQLLTQGTAQADVRDAVVEVLREIESIGTIVERPDPRVRELEQLAPAPAEAIFNRGEAKLATIFDLNGLKFHYDANAGQKTGAFLDQRLNYAAAASYARGRALDVCTYQGGFALHLARVCDEVTAVDQSRAALEVADRNLELNASQVKKPVEWIEGDAFALLREYDAANERFDTIVLDPPAFAKTRRAVEGAMRGYKELNLRALRMLKPGGVLVTCSCSHHVHLEDFVATVAAASADAKRRVRLLETRAAAPDHPEVLTLPETRYLKCLITKVD
ncbi:MAG: class I SAM-dependent rRNA methyltransferase [Acidobacteriaceae bacterium]|nr:class I SAM-dependent rRNA methyltransferase [Acidobacteriaceae bacterium]